MQVLVLNSQRLTTLLHYTNEIIECIAMKPNNGKITIPIGMISLIIVKETQISRNIVVSDRMKWICSYYFSLFRKLPIIGSLTEIGNLPYTYIYIFFVKL